jgi:hypothetical protein
MTRQDERSVLLVGLEDGLLWQLTRVLAQAEPRIEYLCATDHSRAAELSAQTFFHYIVVDGWSPSGAEGAPTGWEELVAAQPWRWIVLVDSLALAGLLDERILGKAVCLEKPLNPKEFPAFLRNLETGGSFPGQAGEVEDAPEVPYPSPSLEPGDAYRSLEPDEGRTPGKSEELPPCVEGSQEAFHDFLETGFASLRHGDLEGARASWQRALGLRPEDKRVRANLARLETARRPPV